MMDALEAELQSQHGLHLHRSFVEATAAALGASFPRLDREQQIQAVFARVVVSDLNTTGSGCLPLDIQTWHDRVLAGRFVLQVDEMCNASVAANQRYESHKVQRMLKLNLTDGKIHVIGYEHRNIPALLETEPVGVKVAVTDALVRRGALFLRPENVVVLGGQVDRLEAGRQRALGRWRQPAVGRSAAARASGQPPDLYAEAAAVAWSAAPQAVLAQPPQQQAVYHGAALNSEAAAPAAHAGPPGFLAGFQRASEALLGMAQQNSHAQASAVAAPGGAVGNAPGSALGGSGLVQGVLAQPAWPQGSAAASASSAPRPAITAVLGNGAPAHGAGAAPPKSLPDEDDELAEPALDNYRPLAGGGMAAFAAQSSSLSGMHTCSGPTGMPAQYVAALPPAIRDGVGDICAPAGPEGSQCSASSSDEPRIMQLEGPRAGSCAKRNHPAGNIAAAPRRRRQHRLAESSTDDEGAAGEEGGGKRAARGACGAGNVTMGSSDDEAADGAAGCDRRPGGASGAAKATMGNSSCEDTMPLAAPRTEPADEDESMTKRARAASSRLEACRRAAGAALPPLASAPVQHAGAGGVACAGGVPRMQIGAPAQVFPVHSAAHGAPTPSSASSLAGLRERAAAAEEREGVFPLSASMHGCIRTVLSTLEFRDEAGAPAAEYALALSLVDDSGDECDADVCPALLLKTIGMSPAELCLALDGGKKPHMREEAVSRILNLQAFLKSFHGRLALRLDSMADTPVVTAWDEGKEAVIELSG